MRCKFVRHVVLPMLCLISFLGAMPSARAEEETVDVLLIGLDRRPGLAGCRSDTSFLLFLTSLSMALAKLGRDSGLVTLEFSQLTDTVGTDDHLVLIPRREKLIA